MKCILNAYYTITLEKDLSALISINLFLHSVRVQYGSLPDGWSQSHLCTQLSRLADRLCAQFALQLGIYVAARNTFGVEDNNDGFGRKQRLRSWFGVRLFGIRVDIDGQRQIGEQVVFVEFLLDFN